MSEVREKSFKRVMVHSFIVIPFAIVVSCALLFAAIQLLIRDEPTAYELLEGVKVGGATRRWQSAFELSRMLAHPARIPGEDTFTQEMIRAFRKSKQDDSRVRQYLALAMGRTGNSAYFESLTEQIAEEKDENLSAVIYAIGMLQDRRGASVITPFLDHPNGRIRSIAVVALGNIADPSSLGALKKTLKDAEPNVQWGAAVSLAKMGDGSGKPVLLNMLDREYLRAFPEVDPEEENYLLLWAIDAASFLDDSQLNAKLQQLSRTDSSLKVRAAALEHLK